MGKSRSVPGPTNHCNVLVAFDLGSTDDVSHRRFADKVLGFVLSQTFRFGAQGAHQFENAAKNAFRGASLFDETFPPAFAV